jgi:parallel beta-helix repeat protein
VDAADAIDADVIIPKGVYCTSESIDATGATNISIRGMGRDVSVIRTLGVSVSVTIDGSSTAGGVLIGNGATNITVEDLWVDHRYLDVGANGIAVFGFTENVPTSTRIAIRRCKVTGVGELHRYNIFVQNCEYFEVTDNLIDGGTTTPNGVADENGIELFGAQYGTVANNTVINCNSAGILCFTQDEYSEWDNKDVVISGNLVQNANRGIAVVATFANANSNLTVANNIILDSVTYGIVGTSDNIGSPTISYLKIDGNTIDGALSATSDGILFTCGGEANVRGLSILGNTIRDVRGTEANGTGGILLFSAGNCDIIGNQIFPMTKASTAWVTSTAYAVGDYVLSSSQVYRCLIAHTSGTFATDLSNGNWTVNDTYGIRLNGGANINVLGNTIQYSPKIPVYLDTIANCTVADNTFKDWTSASAGIHSPAGCSDIHVHNNFFAKASTNGYATFMAGVAGLSITDNRVDTGAALFATPSTFYIHNNCTGTVINHGNQGFLQLFTSVGTGTAYTVTATAAAVDMGTTDPLCTIAYGAKYKLKAKFTLSFNTAAFDGNRTITMKLRRTNNTAADIAGSTRTLATGTRTLEGFVEFVTPEVIYSTVNSTANSTADTIAPYIDVSALPATGTATVVGCEVIWEPLPY